MTLTDITVHGASEHNLKHIDVTIPRLALTTITGVSGSGKSSLAFDTIYQEGQRRYVESLSTYARQFLGRMEKPKVDRIDGLSPALLIDQKTAGRNPRSTVGTITEILDYLRLLYARLGTAHCVTCGGLVSGQSRDTIVDTILEQFAGRRVTISAPVVRDRKGHYKRDLNGWRLKGFARAWIDGSEHRLDSPPTLDRQRRHTIELVIDRLSAEPAKRGRLSEAVETACDLADGLVQVRIGMDDPQTFSTSNTCPNSHGEFPEVEPRLFSFNSPHGACSACNGLGTRRQPDERLVLGDTDLSIRDGCLRIMNKDGYLSYVRLGPRSLEAVAKAFDIDLDKPWKKLPARARKILMHGSGDKEVRLEWSWSSREGSKQVKGVDTKPFPGILPALEQAATKPGHKHAERYFATRTCSECKGTRLNPAARAVTFRDKGLAEVCALTIDQAAEFFAGLELLGRELLVGGPIIKEVITRLGFLRNVGVGYLRLMRSARTLSGGESQRVRLASQVGSGLQGVLYVLDEPSVGLHPRDNKRLIETLGALRDRGNTVVVVEHDADMILASDAMVDIGPGAGRLGGEVLGAGPVAEVLANENSLTSDYLTGRRQIEVPATRRTPPGPELVIRGATQHNLADVDVAFPVGCLTAVTGVSGSGKSTLVDLILRRELARRLHNATREPGLHRALEGVENFDKVIEIDQQPIGRTPRSNPATYTGVMDHVRDVFASTPESKVRGYAKGRFSFNVKGGRCESCQGAGVNVIEMQFLADVEVRCEACDGRRYNTETLEIQYRGTTIDQVLDMTAVEALEFFEHHPRLRVILQTMVDVGLGYVPLGQPSTTLSGGEAQRMKLATELCRPATGRTLYILDEPTTGLHMEDIRVLIAALQRLVDAGNTMVVVEHNLDVIKVADWVVDLGPEGGDGGGRLVVAGTPEQVAATADSETGRYLKPLLKPRRLKVAKPTKRPKASVAAARRGADLEVRGASLHNLKHIDVTVPQQSLTVVTGPSGSGKTSLAFDTIFAEGQRRFVESLSTYARRFLERMERPPVESISGLSPAIAIDQRTAPRNPRSTVATSTEIHDYLRVLYARVGHPHCWGCGKPLRSWTASDAAAELVASASGAKVTITASLFSNDHAHPTLLSRAAEVVEMADEFRSDGFTRLLVDGGLVRLEALPEDPAVLDDVTSIELVIDRTTIDARRRGRLAESLKLAQQRGLGLAHARIEADPKTKTEARLIDFEARPGCARCGHVLAGPLTPRMFSFNSPAGACTGCDGLGQLMRAGEDRLIDRPRRALLEGAMSSKVGAFISRPDGWHSQVLERMAEAAGVDLSEPWADLPAAFRKRVLHGAPEDATVPIHFEKRSAGRSRSYDYEVRWQGLLPLVEGWWGNTEKEGWWRTALEDLLESGPCGTCNGGRLRPEALATTLAGVGIRDVSHMTVLEAQKFFAELALEGNEALIAEDAVAEVRNRLGFLATVGLGYLSLARASSTLSGGEAQRIRLASQLGNRLVGVLYVLDEPSIGLHPRDQQRLLDTLKDLRDLGNTILVVEHDRDTIEAADHVIDLGPGAGTGGGAVMAACPPGKLGDVPESLTGQYLSGRRSVPLPAERRSGGKSLKLKGARRHNLAGLDVEFPLGALTVVTGVSGSGKSTLVGDLLVPAVQAQLDGKPLPPGLKSLTGTGELDKLLVIDQSPIGRSPHSNAATYTGAFDDIRALFASTPEARLRGFGPGRFSCNVPGGRCETCQGRGVEVVEMHFLSDVELPCESCRGRRFERKTLEVLWRGLSIADVLDLEVSRALEFFKSQPGIRRRLSVLDEVGLGYLQLGQPATTLSGGEAQRVKLASELGRPGSGKSLVVLDEPTTGLHFEDVARLVAVLQRIVDQGNTVVVIEHNLDLIKCADRVLDLGPEGGAGGGQLVVAGTPEELVACKASHTGRALAPLLESHA